MFIPPHSTQAAPGNATNATAAAETAAFDGNEGEESDELDGDDDGSRALDHSATAIDVELLRPITPDEEQSLLGDWGDSENED